MIVVPILGNAWRNSKKYYENGSTLNANNCLYL